MLGELLQHISKEAPAFGEERMSERDESDRARLSKIDSKIGNRVQCVRAW